jgi:hypothetical protein
MYMPDLMGIPAFFQSFTTENGETVSDIYEAIKRMNRKEKVTVHLRLFNGYLSHFVISKIDIVSSKLVLFYRDNKAYSVNNIRVDMRPLKSKTMRFELSQDKVISFDLARKSNFKEITDWLSQGKEMKVIYTDDENPELKCTIMGVNQFDPEKLIFSNTYGLKCIIVD